MPRHLRALLLALACTQVDVSAALAATLFQGIGGVITFASDVSGDGTTVVGTLTQPGIGEEAFRWTLGEGLVTLGVLPDRSGSAAFATSWDGSTIVGVGQTSDPTGQARPFRWTSAEGMVELTHPASADGSRANGVSADGSVVGGNSLTSGISERPLTWDLTGSYTDIGDSIQGGRVAAVSGDGTTLVGESTAPGTSPAGQVTRWTTDGQFRLGFSGTARNVSSDGSIVVGVAELSPNLNQAFLWTSSSLSFLGSLPGGTEESQAYSVSADGSIVVGGSDGTLGQRAFIWTAEIGMQDLASYLTSKYGLNLAGWTLGSAQAISDDGTVIAGNGINPAGQSEAWVAIIPEPSTGVLLVAGLLGTRLSRRLP